MAKLEDYPQVVSAIEQGQIEIIDPCIDPNEIYVPPQTDPLDYYYTGEVNQFTLVPFETWPPGCPFSDYTFTMMAGPRLDIVDFVDGESMGSFDPVTGNYQFKSIDVPNYPAGDYVF